MTELTCDICRDLLPLVQDGVASEESRAAVEAHLASCPACRALCGETPPPPPADGEQLLARVRGKLRSCFALLMFLGIFLGVSLTYGHNLFYNTLVMPLIGACGYGVYRWRALWKVPLFVLGLQLLSQLLLLLQEWEDGMLFGALWLGLILSVFAELGVVIAGLFHFAFKKEDRHETT